VRFFVPDIRVSAELEPQATLQDKFGGLPWGLEPDLWPVCSGCGKPQSLLAQLLHDPVRLDLGRQGRVLCVFQCGQDRTMCSTWKGGSGANACFVLEPEDIGSGLTSSPPDASPVENEVRVVGWLPRDDGLRAPLGSRFHGVPSTTRLGGIPCWIHNPADAPGGGWRFVGQLDSTHSFLKAPAQDVPWVHADSDHCEGRTHYGEGPNFGEAGIAYLFLRSSGNTPQGWFFWQCH
jgi:hypothetical protein